MKVSLRDNISFDVLFVFIVCPSIFFEIDDKKTIPLPKMATENAIFLTFPIGFKKENLET